MPSNVIPFRGRRRKVLTSRAALAFLRDRGTIDVSSYAALGDLLGWERSRTSKAIRTWQKAGRVKVLKDEESGKISIVAPPVPWSDRPQKVRPNKPETRRRRSGKSGGKTSGKSAAPEREISPATDHERQREISPSTERENLVKNAAISEAYSRYEIRDAGVADGVTAAAGSPVTERVTGAADRVTNNAEKMEADHPPATAAQRLPRHEGHDARPPADRPVKRHGGGGRTDIDWSEPRIGKWTLAAALVMASFSTVLTVMGFAVLLPGWVLLSMGLGAAMEFGRLVVVGVATRRWHELNGWLRAGALVYILLAESVSLIGVYSELHNLHTGDRPTAAAAAEQGRAEATAAADYQKSVIADFDRQIAALDRDSGALIAADARRGRVRDGRDLMTTQSRQVGQLVDQRRQAAARLASLQGDAARATGKAAVIDAEVGPVRQVAALLHIDAADALRWWLLAITLLVGPCASLLIAMAVGGHRPQ
jgi:hypothetical protein